MSFETPPAILFVWIVTIIRMILMLLPPPPPTTSILIGSSAGWIAGTVHPLMNIQQLKLDSFFHVHSSSIRYISTSIDRSHDWKIEEFPCRRHSERISTNLLLLRLCFYQPLYKFFTFHWNLDPKSVEYGLDFLIQCLMILVDSCVGLLLWKIGTNNNILHHSVSIHQDEIQLEEQYMDSRIYPTYAWILGFQSITTTTTTTTNHSSSKDMDKQNDYINEQQQQQQQQPNPPIISIQSLPLWSCMFYCCNPIILIATSYSSLTTIHSIQDESTNISLQSILYLLILYAIYTSIQQQHQQQDSKKQIALCMAIITSIQPSFILYGIPVIILMYHPSHMNHSSYSKGFVLVYFIVFYIGISMILSFLCTSNIIDFYKSIHWTSRTIRSMITTPNIGLLWYFNIQIFPPFRSFYQTLYSGAPWICIIPLFLRLHLYPLELVRLDLGIYILFL